MGGAFTTTMRYFLINKKNELHVVPVLPENEAIFRLLYEEQIIVEGETIFNVLAIFDELPLIICEGF